MFPWQQYFDRHVFVSNLESLMFSITKFNFHAVILTFLGLFSISSLIMIRFESFYWFSDVFEISRNTRWRIQDVCLDIVALLPRDMRSSFDVTHLKTYIFGGTIFSRLNAPGVYFKLDPVNPAFIRGWRLIGARRLLTDCSFLSFFEVDFYYPSCETQG